MTEKRRSKRERIRSANRKLREKLGRYRRLFFLSSAGLVVLAALLVGFVVMDEPEPVPLGTARAGVMLPDTSLMAMNIPDSLRLPLLREGAVPEAAAPEAAEPEEGRALAGGEASYYGHELAGRPTASGEIFNPARLTAAHRTLPLGSRVRVTNPRTGASVVVRINDRGPFAKRRVIDLSLAAAREIGMLRSGTARVELELLPT